MTTKTPKKLTYRKIPVLGTEIVVYAGKRVTDALKEVVLDMNLYQGVRLSQVLEAVYLQGKKDGARSVFDTVDGLKKTISHRNPGAPRKLRKPKGQRQKKR